MSGRGKGKKGKGLGKVHPEGKTSSRTMEGEEEETAGGSGEVTSSQQVSTATDEPNVSDEEEDAPPSAWDEAGEPKIIPGEKSEEKEDDENLLVITGADDDVREEPQSSVQHLAEPVSTVEEPQDLFSIAIEEGGVMVRVGDEPVFGTDHVEDPTDESQDAQAVRKAIIARRDIVQEQRYRKLVSS